MTPVTYNHQVKPLSSEQQELIHRLVYFQDQYEAPSEKDMKRLTINNVHNYIELYIRIQLFYLILFIHYYSKIWMNMMMKNRVTQHTESLPR